MSGVRNLMTHKLGRVLWPSIARSARGRAGGLCHKGLYETRFPRGQHLRVRVLRPRIIAIGSGSDERAAAASTTDVPRCPVASDGAPRLRFVRLMKPLPGCITTGEIPPAGFPNTPPPQRGLVPRIRHAPRHTTVQSRQSEGLLLRRRLLHRGPGTGRRVGRQGRPTLGARGALSGNEFEASATALIRSPSCGSGERNVARVREPVLH